MQIKIEKEPKNTIKITISIENSKVKEEYEKVVGEAIKETEIDGFRKGTAPKEMVINKVGESNLLGNTLDALLKISYPQALKENHIYPVSNPKVEIKEFDMNKDLEFTALVAVKPEIKIGDYKKEIDHKYTEYKERRKKENEERLKKGEKLDDSHIHMGSNEIIEALLTSSEVEVSDLLIEEETDRLISRLVNQIQAVNLSMDTYLKSQNKTSEQLRKEYEKAAENNIKAEFILNHLVEKEKIDVEEKEVNDMISAIGDENTRKHFEDPIQRLYIKSILQKNKLISKLIEETEGEKHEH